MNKKFLSAILFGALMVSSTGTFVSCKDYDDDIDNINKELSTLKGDLSALQAKVNEGKWITSLAPVFSKILKPEGSIVIEIGNSWEKGRPVQSLLNLKALMQFVENPEAGLRLCQEFICYNPSRLPSPARFAADCFLLLHHRVDIADRSRCRDFLLPIFQDG